MCSGVVDLNIARCAFLDFLVDGEKYGWKVERAPHARGAPRGWKNGAAVPSLLLSEFVAKEHGHF